MVVHGVSEPDPDARHVDGSPVDEVTLVVPGGHGPGAAKFVEGALHGVSLLVGLRVEGRWSSALAPPGQSPGDLVGRLGDGGPDSLTTQGNSDLAGGVGLVGPHPRRASPRPAATGPMDAHVVLSLIHISEPTR